MKIPPVHAAALWVGSMLYIAIRQPQFYDVILQEDHFIEWLTATLFISAGVLRVRTGLRLRRPFDVLIGLFCIFVGGEEFSWGQRLLGFTPPEVFLEHNTQQEVTLHNFAEVFGKPKGILILCLLGYAFLAGLIRIAQMRRWLDRVGATPPGAAHAFWLLVAAGLLIWYPVDLTGEWVELLAAALFMSATPAAWRARVIGAISALVAAALLTLVSARALASSPARLQCAQLEVEALLSDVLESLHTHPDLRTVNAHKRILSAAEAGYLPAHLPLYAGTRCAGESELNADRRHRYMIDPWGMAYWLRSRNGTTFIVYSFGPDRRRSGDDVAATFSAP